VRSRASGSSATRCRERRAGGLARAGVDRVDRVGRIDTVGRISRLDRLGAVGCIVRPERIDPIGCGNAYLEIFF
jgi:hypothetical protein